MITERNEEQIYASPSQHKEFTAPCNSTKLRTLLFTGGQERSTFKLKFVSTMKATVWLVVLFAFVWNESSAWPWSSSDSGNDAPRRPGWPSFSELERNYPRYPIIFGLLGGPDWDELVDQEGLDAWLKDQEVKNTCAMRVSRALTHAGRQIVPPTSQTECKWKETGDNPWSEVRDSRGRPYIIRVATMRCYLENQQPWNRQNGRADVTGTSESDYRVRANRKNIRLTTSKLQPFPPGHQGIIVFQDCNFETATGHVDLWDGSGCVGSCRGYFSRCTDINLFEF
ncbi:uncharacterized protein LOC144861592 [Branchiostoma floridae x Branchiostoma japonicum]